MACTFQAKLDVKFALLNGLRNDDMGIDSVITTYNIACKCPGTSEIFSTLVMRGVIWRRGVYKQNQQNIQGSKKTCSECNE